MRLFMGVVIGIIISWRVVTRRIRKNSAFRAPLLFLTSKCFVGVYHQIQIYYSIVYMPAHILYWPEVHRVFVYLDTGSKMSRNGKYYIRKIDKATSKGCVRIDTLFGKPPQDPKPQSIEGPGQIRTVTTSQADIVPDFSAVRRKLNKDPTKKNEAGVSARVFTYMTAGAAAVPGIYTGKTLVQTLVGSFSTTKDVLALAKLEVKLSDIPEGKSLMVKWRGKPVYIRHRTPEEFQKEAEVNLSELRDPQHDTDRCLKEDWLVVIGICTHLGCVPVADIGEFGGFYCPCHGSHYDTSGRIRKGPAPLNLEVPAYVFPDDETLVIG